MNYLREESVLFLAHRTPETILPSVGVLSEETELLDMVRSTMSYSSLLGLVLEIYSPN